MDAQRWKQVDSLLQLALERPAEEREAFLRRACGGDEALEREVRSLLASQQQAGSFLESPALELAEKTLARDECLSDPSTAAVEPGTMISHYRLTGKLGAGGMGDVCRARDTKLQRDVVRRAGIAYISRLVRRAKTPRMGRMGFSARQNRKTLSC
jgi:eukaryotic-like serine/threonine-protein kinase